MSNILISMLCYIINILLFKFAGIIHTLIIVFLLKDGKVDEYLMRTAENKVRPWIPYYIFGFTIFSAYFYMSTLNNINFLNTLFTSSLWSFIFVVHDFIFCMKQKELRNYSLKKVYIDEQPWTSLSYLALFVAPLIASLLVNIDIFIESTFSSCPIFNFFYII